MIKLVNIDKIHASRAVRHYALRRVGLEVRRGEFVTIMGPSGAGKSTLLGIIGMLDGDWEGEYYFDGRPIHTMRQKERAEIHRLNIGFVFQQYHLLDNLTVAENLEIPLSYRAMERPARRALVADMLDRFGIVAKKDLYPNQLSGGQQQLVGVARALIFNPALILADEPTGNLHSSQGHEVMALFKELNRAGTTIIQVTHAESNAACGDRIIRLRDGAVIDENRMARIVAML